MNAKPYLAIVAACEADLEKYGDNYLGVGWTKSQAHADLRYQIMVDVVRRPVARVVDVLDFGCGASHLYEYIQAHAIPDLQYSGLDLSEKFLALSMKKFPHVTYYHADLLDEQTKVPTFDYVLMNGLFNYKGSLSHAAMWEYVQATVRRVAQIARVGLAFNVMSKYVDWERDDLFHLPLDTAAAFVTRDISRHFCIRHDYGLYEYTLYVYKQPLIV